MNVSVVMAVRDGERHLAEALASIHAQTVAPLEILLVDGGSHDATREIAVAHGARVIAQRGDTLADAYNTGIEDARGDVVAFLSYDDTGCRASSSCSSSASAPPTPASATPSSSSTATRPPGFRAELLDGPRAGARDGGARRAARPVRARGRPARGRFAGRRRRLVRAREGPRPRGRGAAGDAAAQARARGVDRAHLGDAADPAPARLGRAQARAGGGVVPVRDGERYLEAALRSLLDQTRPPDELIVVDDGSRDGSASLAEALGARVLRRPPLGAAAARNAGVRATSADLLAFLDADDLAEPRRSSCRRRRSPLGSTRSSATA